jgi:ribonuclease BN (tRNA processing enzyme)
MEAFWKKDPVAIKGSPFSISGYSVAARNTGFYVHGLETMLDSGITTDKKVKLITVTHGHGDHSFHLPQNLIDTDVVPTIVVPEEIGDYVANHIKTAFVMSKNNPNTKVEFRYKLVRASPGMLIDVELNNSPWKLEIIKCFHTVPTIGFGFNEMRKKLKTEIRLKIEEMKVEFNKSMEGKNEDEKKMHEKEFAKKTQSYIGDISARYNAIKDEYDAKFKDVVTRHELDRDGKIRAIIGEVKAEHKAAHIQKTAEFLSAFPPDEHNIQLSTFEYGTLEAELKIHYDKMKNDRIGTVVQIAKDNIEAELSTFKPGYDIELAKYDVNELVAYPHFCYLGDTTWYILDQKNSKILEKYKCLIIECTFLYPEHLEHAILDRHMHWSKLKKYIEDHPDQQIIIIHPSARYTAPEIDAFYADKMLPNMVVWNTSRMPKPEDMAKKVKKIQEKASSASSKVSIKQKVKVAAKQ